MVSNVLFTLIHLINFYATFSIARSMWNSYRQYKEDGIDELIGDLLTFSEKLHNKLVDLFMVVVSAAAIVNLCFSLLHIYLVLQGLFF